MQLRRLPLLGAVTSLEASQVRLILGQPARSGRFLLFPAADFDVPAQLTGAAKDTLVGIVLEFRLGELHRPQGGEVLGVFRHDDEILGPGVGRYLDVPFFPDALDVVGPALVHAANVGVRATQQQHLGPQGVAAGEHRQVLLDDGLEEGGHQLVRGHALLLQPVDVGLREDPALAGHRVQAQAHVAHAAELVGRDLELGVDLVDDRPGAARALVVHRGDLLLLAGLLVGLEDDDLGVLAAELDHALHVGIELLDGQRNGVDLLHELGPDVPAHRRAARAGHEDAEGVARHLGEAALDGLQHLQALLGLLGVVPLVVLGQDLAGRRVDHHVLDRGRADVQADQQALRIGGRAREGERAGVRAGAFGLELAEIERDQAVGLRRGGAAARPARTAPAAMVGFVLDRWNHRCAL